MINGVINIYKEAGYTSFDVVAKLRRILKIKKIGHTGTLDPDAVGVLPVCVGNATKLVDMLTDRTKEYIAIMKLGVVTDTQDMSGEVLAEDYESAEQLSYEKVRAVVESFKGEIQQIPPMYSALKINGQKLCDLARQGIEVERKSRPVTIYNIDVQPYDEECDGLHNARPRSERQSGLHNVYYLLKVECSKGTYIRTLIHDIGQKLGCGAAMEHLERTRVGKFRVEDAITIAQIENMVKGTDESTAKDVFGDDVLKDRLGNVLTEVDIILDEYAALHVTAEGMKALDNGNKLYKNMIKEWPNDVVMSTCNENARTYGDIMLTNGAVYRMYSYDNQFRALYRYDMREGALVVEKMFG